MNIRLLLIAALLLSACGSGDSATPQKSPAAATNIATWSDSLGTNYPTALALLQPTRVVFNGAVGGQTSTQVVARILADTGGRDSWISVLWMGRNNAGDHPTIKADIAQAIATLKTDPKEFIVLAVLNTSTEVIGTSGHSVITALNSDLQSLYPQNYIDIRSYLVTQYDPTSPQDVIDYQNDCVPESLRSDGLHLGPKGDALVAAKVNEFILSKGW